MVTAKIIQHNSPIQDALFSNKVFAMPAYQLCLRKRFCSLGNYFVERDILILAESSSKYI